MGDGGGWGAQGGLKHPFTLKVKYFASVCDIN